MNKQDLQLLGLEEGATKEEITTAYETLRAKYLEERFMDGEVGNNAAKMLTKIDAAYQSLLNELAEKGTTSNNGTSENLEKVSQLIRDGQLDEAQRQLDAFDERDAQWHYLQSVVFYKKNWQNESKKQLEIAIQLDPSNEKYKEAYRKMNENAKSAPKKEENPDSAYRGQTFDDTANDQMGGDMCSSCVECCACNALLNCMCNGCCR